MADLVQWLNREREIHPVLVSGIAQFQLVHIHPFLDGNGRTARLLSTLSLYRAGYDFKRLFTISEYYDRDRAAFYFHITGGKVGDGFTKDHGEINCQVVGRIGLPRGLLNGDVRPDGVIDDGIIGTCRGRVLP